MITLGVDFGDRRLGFAASDPDGILAVALEVVGVNGFDEAVKAIIRMCKEKQAERLVVGLPLSMSGAKGPMALMVQKACEQIRTEMAIPIITWDERLTTVSAERAMQDACMSSRKTRHVRDKIAAQIILQSYLDSQIPARRDPDDT